MYDICWSMINDQLLIIGYDHWSCYDQLLIISYDHWSLPWSTVDHTLWSLIIAMINCWSYAMIIDHCHERLLIIHDQHWSVYHIVTTICLILEGVMSGVVHLFAYPTSVMVYLNSGLPFLPTGVDISVWHNLHVGFLICQHRQNIQIYEQ